ncbi:bifunctional glutamate N-acetyltransferase/amino-acid acetyltransferase ArgJ [Pacificibacter marinus]|uniref:Arginine biosynthesis bifunctional protein ArgJ n=1 Tax=Pacificibacter marinus TaxID=658057 RepID=A0A1Y5T0J9_9RHOB|nr:bifunctional glutamate N-acetyltransferase/amino-acid acetyltransferase ArgJ [Pacificibacter marinus]SEL02325.1 glutamate N-acetyltransferase [Pacificibacter marinus]SLN52446.1 Arginine biosynthesis bifunctional protein ArgJ [Pacificibacter marinus]
MAKIESVSPLAPVGGFPDLPIIDGVTFSSLEAGVRYTGRTDVMLAELCPGSVVAGTFTTSSTRSAAVLDCQKKLGSDASGGAAIFVNSGNSNAFTGKSGLEAVGKITEAISSSLGINENRIFTSSTGVIGEPLKWERITTKIDALKAGLQPDGITGAAKAIMTTDTFAKGASAEVTVGGEKIKIAGIAKGSGMIAPDMATMLVYIFTDAKIAQSVLQDLVSRATNTTFNCITVDSDTSTSDTLIAAATGCTSAPEILAGTPEANNFFTALQSVMLELSHLVVKDGEGATKFVEVQVTGASSDADARKIASSIANSPLVKTAIAGEDPNWGRVVMAVGKSGAAADRDLLSIRFGDVLVAENGWVSPNYSEEAAASYMKNDHIILRVDIGLGASQCTMWTCDLTHGYITINADYRS